MFILIIKRSAIKLYIEIKFVLINKSLKLKATHIVDFWRLENDSWILIKTIKMLTKASDLKFNDDYLIVSDYFFTIKSYSLNSNELIFNYIGHTAKICSFDFNQNFNLISSCSADKTWKVWSMTKHESVSLNSSLIEFYPLKISIIETNNSSLIIILIGQRFINIKNVKLEKSTNKFKFSKLYVLNSCLDDSFDNNGHMFTLDTFSHFTFINNLLTGYFTLLTGHEKFYTKNWMWNTSLEEYVLKSNNYNLEPVNQYLRIEMSSNYKVVAFGFW